MATKRPISEAKSPVFRGSWAALKRAAERARRIAAQTGTAIVVARDGRIEHVYPSGTPVAPGVGDDQPPYGGKRS